MTAVLSAASTASAPVFASIDTSSESGMMAAMRFEQTHFDFGGIHVAHGMW
jgi:hypothetical protein